MAYKQWTLCLYSITCIFLFADQNLLSPNLSAAAKDFGFNDLERDEKLGGHIAIAFFLVGAPASFIVGCLADSHRIKRNILFGIIVLIGEGSCLAAYFTSTYEGLYATRALTGFSVGGALPVLSSVLGDWYPPEEQSKVMALIGIGSALGIAMGQGISGMIGPSYGWRMPFLVIGFPAVLLAFLFIFTTMDPIRGSYRKKDAIQLDHRVSERTTSINSKETQEKHSNDDASVNYTEYSISERWTINHSHPTIPPFDIEKDCHSSSEEGTYAHHQTMQTTLVSTSTSLVRTRGLLQTPTVLLALIQGAPGCIPWGMINTYLNDYLSSNMGMSVQEATSILMIFSIGVFFGMLIGAYGGKYLYVMDIRFPSLLAGGMAILGCIPIWIMINIKPFQETDTI